jgi:hypothetical protein
MELRPLMRESRIIKFITLFLLFLVFLFYVGLRIENSHKVREPRASFGDVHEYLEVASEPVISKSFWIAIRPPVVPLVYKITGTDINTISSFQLWFSILAWTFLASVVASTSRSYFVKPVAFGVILGFSLSQKIIMWDYLILSESIAISLMVIFLATSLLLIANWTWLRLVMFGIAGLLFVFTRDVFGYYFLMIGCGLVPFVFFVARKKHLLVVSSYLILLFFISNTLANSSGRWYHSLLNTISIRILPNEQYIGYFEERGMPVNEALLSRSGKHLHADSGILMTDAGLQEFRSWVMKHGKQEYVRFLWFYKADALQNIFEDIQPLFNPNLIYYSATGFAPIIRDLRISELLYPDRFSIFILLIANLLAAAASVVAIYERKSLWLLPLCLIFFTYPQAVFIWNADANEVGRHSLYHNIQWRLGLWLLLLYGLDFVIELMPKIQTTKVNWYLRNETQS